MSAEKQLLISFANWVTENDIKNLRPEQLAEFYLEEHAKQSKQEEVEFSNFETCVRSFIRSKHLSYEWDKWIAEWYEKTPTPREG